MLSPVEFGLPEKFTDWRRAQWEALNFIVDSPQRFITLCAPTGFGKSLTAMAAAHMSGLRTVYLTSTKGLQDQINHDFADLSTDIRGMQNYTCDAAEEFGYPSYTRVSDAPCQAGAKCSLEKSGCKYFDSFRLAQTANIVVTNYQCWMYDSLKRDNLKSERPVEMLICDEAHDSVSALSDYLAVVLERKECLAIGVPWPKSGLAQAGWQEWARYSRIGLVVRRGGLAAVLAADDAARELAKQIEQSRVGGVDGVPVLAPDTETELSEPEVEPPKLMSSSERRAVLNEIQEIKNLERKLDRVAGMQDDWVIEELDASESTMKAVKFDPLWPRKYRESLFRGVPKVVLVSATVRPKTTELLGIPAEEMAFKEYPSGFPVANRPVVHVPTVRMNHQNEADDGVMMWLLRKIDLLVGARLDRKGVIHTVSYKRARFILDNSRHRSRMLIHGTDNRASVIAQFLRAGPGTVLLSPSVDTGYDFKGDTAEYQLIVKLPFPDGRGAVMKARTKEDKDYGMYLTAQILQQMTGRVCRSETDRGETLVLDDNIAWFPWKFKRFFNQWWLSSFRTQTGRLPEPLPKL